MLVLTGGRAEIWQIELDHAELQRAIDQVNDANLGPNGQLALVFGDGVRVVDVNTGETIFTRDGVRVPEWLNMYLQACQGDPCTPELWNVEIAQLIASGGDVPIVVSPDRRFGAEARTGIFRL